MKPTLAVDARALHGSGVGRYMREVVRGLVERGAFDRVRLVGNRAELEPFVGALPASDRVEIVEMRGGRFSLKAQVEWTALVVRGSLADVVFFPHIDVPVLAMPRRSVVTVHDLILLRVPGATSLARRTVARFLLTRSVRGAARLITTSSFTRDDLLTWFPGATDRVTVTAAGVAEAFRCVAPPVSALPVGVRAPYLLCVANRKPHKNLETAVDVFARLGDRFPELQLVVAGEHFPSWAATMAHARSVGVAHKIVDLGPLSDATLHALYAHATVYLHPSRYEGFGLPILEAMASGTPVVASNAASIPEVAGDAALLSAPDDAGAMALRVERLMTDVAFRAAQIARGREQSARFRWSRTAEDTERVLLEAAAS